MPRDLLVDLRVGGGSAPEVAYGTVYLTPTAIHSSGTALVLPAPTEQPLVNGTATFTGVLESPEGENPEWAYNVRVSNRTGTKLDWTVGLPTGTGTANLLSLPQYNEVAVGHALASVQKRPQVACAIRNSGSGWQLISDAGHRPVGVASVDTFSDRIVLNLEFTAKKVLGADVTMDETLSRKGYVTGPSVGLSTITLWLTDLKGISDYVYWDATAGLWKSFTGVFTFPSGIAGFGPDRLDPNLGVRLAHTEMDISDGLAAFATARGGTYVASVGSVGVANMDVQFFDWNGVHQTTPNADMKVWVTRPGAKPLDPTKVVSSMGNIWVTAYFDL